MKFKKSLLLLFALLLCAMLIACDEATTNKPQETTAPEETAHQHSFGEWSITKEATCAEKGTQERACACGEKETQSIDKLAHTEVIDEALAPTCTAIGLTAGKHCSVCNEVLVAQEEVQANGHSYGEWDETLAPTCTEKGSERRDCDDCDHYETRDVNAVGHTFGEWTQTLAPTCTEKGSERRDCDACDHYETRDVKAKGHEYNTVVTPPTNKDQGYTTHTCTVCLDSYVDSYVPATGSLGLTYAINSDGKTCTVTGMGICTDTEVYIPDQIDGYKVTSIGEQAFADCTTITFIKLPEIVTTIGTRAFYGCTGITELTIPASVTGIGAKILHGCDNLTTVYYNSTYSSSSNPFLSVSSIKKIVFGGACVPHSILEENPYVVEVEIKAGITYIDNSAFYRCSSLTHVSIPDSVTSIFKYAFYGCSSLTNITLPDSGISIHYFAFQNCGLTNIIIPDNVKYIDSGVFCGCRNLTSITIPKSVRYIPGFMFEDCYNLETIYYGGTASDWLNMSIGDYNDPLFNTVTCYYYSETQPTTTGNYWHYVDGVPTKW